MVDEVFRNLVENPSFEYGADGLSTGSAVRSVWRNDSSQYSPFGLYNVRLQFDEASAVRLTAATQTVEVSGAAFSWLGFAVNLGASFGDEVSFSFQYRMRDGDGAAIGGYIRSARQAIPRGNADTRFVHALALDPSARFVEVGVEFGGEAGGSWSPPPVDVNVYTDGWRAVGSESERAALDQVATYFDGDTPDAPGPDGYGWVYEWDGEPGASSSTKSWGQAQPVAVRVVEDLDAPAVGITVEGLSSVESSRIAIYRQTPGKERTLVQGLGNVDVDGAGYWVDYLPPLGVPVTYVVEVLEGDPLEENSATITIPSSTAWLQDALNPLLAVEVACRPGNRDTIWFTAEAFTAFERPTNSDLVQIMGGRTPVGMTSRRQTPVGIPFNMVTTAAEASSLLREVLIEGTHLVLRVPPEISMLDPVTYLSDVQVSEEPSRQTFLGGHVIRWNMTGSQTRGPRIMAWTALWTYDDVADLYAGYSYTDLTDGRRYVQWQASPDEAQLAGFSTTSGGSNA